MNRVDPLREGSGECEALDKVRRRPLMRVPSQSIKNIFSNHELAEDDVSFAPQTQPSAMPYGSSATGAGPIQKFRNTESDATLAPLVFGTLKFSYSSRAPTMLMCACTPMPHANSVPLVERLAGDTSELTLPFNFQRARPTLPKMSTIGSGIGKKPTA